MSPFHLFASNKLLLSLGMENYTIKLVFHSGDSFKKLSTLSNKSETNFEGLALSVLCVRLLHTSGVLTDCN